MKLTPTHIMMARNLFVGSQYNWLLAFNYFKTSTGTFIIRDSPQSIKGTINHRIWILIASFIHPIFQ